MVFRRGLMLSVSSNEEMGVRDIIYGLLLVAMGFLLGGSVFLGDFHFWPILFDGVAVFLILRGVVTLLRRRQIKA